MMAYWKSSRRGSSWRALLLLAATLSLARCGPEPVSPSPGALSAKGGNGGGETADPVVDSVSPSDAPRNLTLDLTVRGAGFDRGSRVTIEHGGIPADKITTTSTRFVNSQTLVANVTVDIDAEPSLYDVAVTTSSGKRGIGVERFEVLALIVLAPPPGQLLMWTTAINDARHVAGIGFSAPFFWEDGQQVVPIQTGRMGLVDDMNDLDQVVGADCSVPGCSGMSLMYGALWERSGAQWTVRQITGLGGRALAIDDQGVIYGNDPSPAQWAPDGDDFIRTDLPVPAGYGNVKLRTANSTGQASGGPDGTDATKTALPVLWTLEQGVWSVMELPTPPGASDPMVVGLGDVTPEGRFYAVGKASVHGRVQAFRWTFSRQSTGWRLVSIENLGAAFKGRESVAFAVNSRGDAVGHVFKSGDNGSPVRWPLVGPPGVLPYPAGSYGRASAISENGWIAGLVGVATPTGWGSRAAIWRGP